MYCEKNTLEEGASDLAVRKLKKINNNASKQLFSVDRILPDSFSNVQNYSNTVAWFPNVRDRQVLPHTGFRPFTTAAARFDGTSCRRD